MHGLIAISMSIQGRVLGNAFCSSQMASQDRDVPVYAKSPMRSSKPITPRKAASIQEAGEPDPRTPSEGFSFWKSLYRVPWFVVMCVFVNVHRGFVRLRSKICFRRVPSRVVVCGRVFGWTYYSFHYSPHSQKTLNCRG